MQNIRIFVMRKIVFHKGLGGRQFTGAFCLYGGVVFS